MTLAFRSGTFFRSPRLFAGVSIISILLSTIPAIPAFAAPAATADSLNAYWKLDEASAGTFLNSSGETNTGTGNGASGAQNTPQPSSDVPSGMAFTDTRSLSFDGTDDYVSMSANPFTSNDFTISIWVAPTTVNDGNYHGFFGREAGGGSWTYRSPVMWVGPSNGVLHYMIVDTGGTAYYDYLQNFFTTSGEWVHVAMVKNGTDVKFYRNGVLMYTRTGPTNIFKAGTDFQLGKVDNYFDGKLDDVRVYNRALYPGQIVDLAAGRNPAVYWKGTNSTGLENAANWSGSYVPDPYSRIVIQPRTIQPVMTGALRYAGLVISTGAILKTNGTGITLIENGVFNNYGTLAIKGTETFSGITSDSAKGTILVYGSGSYSSLPTGSAYYNLTQNDGLVGYWKLDETSGTRTADSSGWGNSGALIGGATISTTVPSLNFSNPRSLYFDGVNDYVNTGNNNSLNRGSLPFTIAAWFKVDTAEGVGEWRPIVEKGDGDAIVNYGLWTSANPYVNKIDFLSGNGDWGDTISTTTILPNTWYHALGTWDGTTKRLYVNGVLEKSSVPSSTEKPVASPETFKIGGSRGSVFLNGNVDDVRIYNRVLKPFEIVVLASGNQPSTGLGTITLNATTTVNGSLTLNSGTLDVSTSQYGLIVGKSWLNNGGKFVPRSSTITFAGTTSGLEILSGGQRFAKMTFSGAGGTWNVRDRLTASGTAVMTAGTLDTPDSYPMHFGQFSQVGGTIVPRSGIIGITGHNLTSTFTSTLNTLQVEDPQESGLVGYWKFDEGTNSGAIIDSSKVNPVGVRRGGTGAIIWTGSVLPSLNFYNRFAMHFGGAPGDAVSIPVSSAFPSTPTNITQAAWIRTTALGSMVVVTRRNQILNNNSDWPTIQVNGGGVAILVDDRSYGNATSFIPVNDGQWHHVAGVKSGTTYSIYVDGTFRDSFTDAHSMDGSPGLNYNIGLGPNWSGSNFIGDIDDVRVYNRILSAAEILNLARGNYANGSTAGTLTLGGNLTASTMTLASGIVSAGSNTLSVSGDWNNYAGSEAFVPGTSTVNLNSTSPQVIRGSTNFSTLNITTSTARTVSISSGSILSIATNLVMTGMDSAFLTLAPLVAGYDWFLNLAALATRTVRYVSVNHSNASPGQQIVVDGGVAVNGGSNTNWSFVYPSISFQSGAFTRPESAGTLTVQLLLSGSTTGTVSIPYTISGTATDGADFTQITHSPLVLQPSATATGIVLQLNDDTELENEETIIITLGTPTNATLGATTMHTLILTSEDFIPLPAGPGLGGNRGTLGNQRIFEALARLSSIHFVAPKDNGTSTVASTQTKTFNDVSPDAWYAGSVQLLYEMHVINGVDSPKGGRDFLPTKPVTYAELAKIALLAAAGGDLKLVNPKTASLDSYLSIARNRKISVFADKKVQADAPATRGDVSQVFVEMFGLNPSPLISVPGFTDLPDGHPRFRAMRTLYSQGILTGDAGKTSIRPNAPVNRAEIATMFGRLFGAIKDQSTLTATLSVSSSPAAILVPETPAPVSPPAPPVTPTPTPVAKTYRIISKRLHLRADSRISADSLRNMWYGGILTVDTILPNGWAAVKTSDGKKGYVMMKYIEAVQ